MKKYIIDERLESVVVALSDSQKVALRQSIELRGCLDPIVVWGDIVWDGVERYRICKELGLDFDVKSVEFRNIAEAARERIRHHQNRRQMNVVNRIESALDLFEGELAEEAKANQLEGARKGGLAKAGTDVSPLEENNKTWVNSLIAELAETNSVYVSRIRNLREDANNNNSDAKDKLFKLRRGEIGISSLKKASESKKSSSCNKGKTNTNSSQKTLLEQYDDGKWGMEFALKEMEYDKLKERIADNEKEFDVINHDMILEVVAPYCKENQSHSLLAHIVPVMEICYRLGFIKGLQETSEDSVKAEFCNRDFRLHSQFRNWLQDQDDEIYVMSNDSQSDEIVA